MSVRDDDSRYTGRFATLARCLAVSVAVAAVLYTTVYLNLGTRWGFEIHLNPYYLGLAVLPLGFAVVTRRRSSFRRR